MPISEERLQLLLPRSLKASIRKAAKRKGISIGKYIRTLVEAELSKEQETVLFPFGQNPIRTGRRHGSQRHDRPEE